MQVHAEVEPGLVRARCCARLALFTVSLVVAAGCVSALAESARAAPVRADNWPNSPVRHTLRERIAATTPSFAANLRGGVAVAGNTLETCPANLPFVRTRRRTRRRAANEPCINDYNNGQDMQYVNIDPGDGRFNSSSATLTIPAGATVVRAFLYWAADLSRGIEVNGQRTGHAAPGGDTPEGRTPHQGDQPHSINTVYGTVHFRAGAGASYSTINAFDQGPDQARWDSINSWYSVAPSASQPEGGSPGWAYQVRGDVTSELQNAIATRGRTRDGDTSIPITVADVQAGTGYNRYAGWNLIVVWQSPTVQFRNITLFDGFDFVQVQGGQQLVVGPLDFTGFRTPATGDLRAHATVWATEGDRTITGDYMSLGNLTTNCGTLTKQSDAAHPVDNFFNSKISAAGVTVGGRTPGFDNQLGFDLARLSVPEGTIANGATGASVCLGTTGDTYFFGGLIFDTLIKAPNLQISKTVEPSHANPGNPVTYTTTVTNPQRSPDDPLGPTDAATNLVVSDPIPSGLDFVEFTVNPGGVCTYETAIRQILCEVGTLEPDASFSFAFEARVNAVAQGDSPAELINSACYESNSEDQEDVSFTGCDQAPVIVPPAPPEPADLGVVKTVDHEIVKPGATITWRIVGTNYGPAVSTNFVLADQLPAGVEFVSATHSPALTCTTPPVGSTGAITCTAPSVPARPAAGSSLTLTIVATVPADTPDNTLLQNVATVSGDQPEPEPDLHPNDDNALTLVHVPDTPVPPIPPLPPDPIGPPEPPAPPEPLPDIPSGPAGTVLRVVKSSSPRVVQSGQTISYTLRVTNVGEAEALRVRVCDTPPRGVSVISAPGFSRSGASICTTISRLPISASRTFRITAAAGSGTRGRIVNQATAAARNARPVHSTAPVTVVRPPPFTG